MATYQLADGTVVSGTVASGDATTPSFLIADDGRVVDLTGASEVAQPERTIAEQLGFSKADLARYEAAGLSADEVGSRLQTYLQRTGTSPYDIGFAGQSARDRIMGFQVDPRQEAAEQYALNQSIMRGRAGEPTIAGLDAGLVQGLQTFASIVGGLGGLPGLPIPSTGNAIVDAALQGGGRGAISSALSGQDIGAGALKGATTGAIGGGVSEASQAAGIPTNIAQYTTPVLTAALTGGNPLIAALQQGIRGATAEPGTQYRTSGAGYGSPDYSYEAQLQTDYPDLPDFDQPLYDLTTGEQLTPEQVAEQFPELYPGGNVPEEGQETVYGRSEGGLNVPSGLLANILGSGMRSPSTGSAIDMASPSTRDAGTTRYAAVPSEGGGPGQDMATVSALSGLGGSIDPATAAGELDTTRTGGKRRKVWNVASLRNLQDALGV